MTTNLAMRLSHQIAKRIIEHVAAGVRSTVSVTNEMATVIASSDVTTLGISHNLAAQAILNGALARTETAAGAALGLPLVHSGCVVGAIVLDSAGINGDELAYMARTLAELIIHQMTVIDQLPRQPWAREKFLFDLLHGHLVSPDEIVLQEAALFDIDLTVPRLVVLIAFEAAQPHHPGSPQSSAAQPVGAPRYWLDQREGELLALAREIMRLREADTTSFIGNRWLTIFSTVDTGAVEASRQRIAHDLRCFIDTLAQRGDATATAGIGRFYSGWRALAQSFADARFALETGWQIYGPAKAFMPSDLGVASFVCSNDPVLKAQIAHHLLNQIESQPELLNTITVFLETDLSPSRTAARLHIHRHTLANRLDKVARLTGLDPHRFHQLAQLHAALVFRQTHAAG